MGLIKSPFDIIAEASETDGFYRHGLIKSFQDDSNKIVMTDYNAYPEVANKIDHTAESTNIYEVEEGVNAIEYDDLLKFMEDADIHNVNEAMRAVCEANGAEFKNTYLIVPNEEDMAEYLNEAKCKLSDKTKNKVSKKLKKTAAFMKHLKKNGVKTLQNKKAVKEDDDECEDHDGDYNDDDFDDSVYREGGKLKKCPKCGKPLAKCTCKK